jgi:hypothetical protein
MDTAQCTTVRSWTQRWPSKAPAFDMRHTNLQYTSEYSLVDSTACKERLYSPCSIQSLQGLLRLCRAQDVWALTDASRVYRDKCPCPQPASSQHDDSQFRADWIRRYESPDGQDRQLHCAQATSRAHGIPAYIEPHPCCVPSQGAFMLLLTQMGVAHADTQHVYCAKQGAAAGPMS